MLLSKGNKCGLAYVMTLTGLIVPYTTNIKGLSGYTQGDSIS